MAHENLRGRSARVARPRWVRRAPLLAILFLWLVGAGATFIATSNASKREKLTKAGRASIESLDQRRSAALAQIDQDLAILKQYERSGIGVLSESEAFSLFSNESHFVIEGHIGILRVNLTSTTPRSADYLLGYFGDPNTDDLMPYFLDGNETQLGLAKAFMRLNGLPNTDYRTDIGNRWISVCDLQFRAGVLSAVVWSRKRPYGRPGICIYPLDSTEVRLVRLESRIDIGGSDSQTSEYVLFNPTSSDKVVRVGTLVALTQFEESALSDRSGYRVTVNGRKRFTSSDCEGTQESGWSDVVALGARGAHLNVCKWNIYIAAGDSSYVQITDSAAMQPYWGSASEDYQYWLEVAKHWDGAIDTATIEMRLAGGRQDLSEATLVPPGTIVGDSLVTWRFGHWEPQDNLLVRLSGRRED